MGGNYSIKLRGARGNKHAKKDDDSASTDPDSIETVPSTPPVTMNSATHSALASSSSSQSASASHSSRSSRPAGGRSGGSRRKFATEQGQDPLSIEEDAVKPNTAPATASAAQVEKPRSLKPAAVDDQSAVSAKQVDDHEANEARHAGVQVFEHGVNQREHIADALAVEEIDADLFKSVSLWTPSRARGVFGGQVIAQALSAASKTVRPGPVLHSMHCYFLLAGDETIPIIYTITRVRDGGSYVTRNVNASQRGRTIFTLIASYQMPEPAQPSFAIPLPRMFPDVALAGTAPARQPEPPLLKPGQEGSISWHSFVETLRTPEQSPCNEDRYSNVLKLAAKGGVQLPKTTIGILEGWISDRRNSAVEIRDALPGMYDAMGRPTPGSGQAFWMRTREPMRGGADAQKHALAYASDFYLLSAVPKALGLGTNIKMMASLDHSMWFYQDFDVHDWILYVMQTQSASNGRGVVLGRLYNRNGALIAVVAQEGLVRKRFKEDKSEKGLVPSSMDKAKL